MIDFDSIVKLSLIKFEAFKRQQSFNNEQQIELLEDLILAMNANQSVLEAMRANVTYCVDKNMLAYESILEILSRGDTLSEALTGWFPPMIIISIRSGEGHRQVVPALVNAKEALMHQSGVIVKLLKKNIYPLIMILSSIGLNIFTSVSIISPMIDRFPIKEMPMLSRYSYEFGQFFICNYIYIILFIIVIVISIRMLLSNWLTEKRFYLDNFIFFRQYRLAVASSFLRSMSIMLKSKEMLNKALGSINNGGNNYLSYHVSQMLRNQSGNVSGIGIILDTGLLEDIEIARIKSITRKTNKGVDELLLLIAIRHEKILDKSTNRISKWINFVGISFALLLAVLATVGQMLAQFAEAGTTL